MYDWRYPIDQIRGELREARSSGNEAESLNDMEALLGSLTSVHLTYTVMQR